MFLFLVMQLRSALCYSIFAPRIVLFSIKREVIWKTVCFMSFFFFSFSLMMYKKFNLERSARLNERLWESVLRTPPDSRDAEIPIRILRGDFLSERTNGGIARPTPLLPSLHPRHLADFLTSTIYTIVSLLFWNILTFIWYSLES